MNALSQGITLRPAGRHDIRKRGEAGIRDLFNAVRQHERREGRQPLSPPQYADWARRMDQQGPGTKDEAIVALQGNAVIAFYLARHDSAKRVTRLDKLFVHPDLQHQGIGRMLMRHLTVSAETRGQHDIVLRAEAGHNRASGFYQKLGYTVVETRPGRPPVDVLTRPA